MNSYGNIWGDKLGVTISPPPPKLTRMSTVMMRTSHSALLYSKSTYN
uniref:Uncharacterized protein n=1 Tax=Anguilla anguilla TaxID=7936 RepID=A0A0E9XU88_ANGAN